ncbi:antitoxin [Kribbella sp.]|uniref:antitoxin n=1 Tax=Kribbella sp. TaxID=1871183 RepID=UPI002D2B7AFB|nr:antitoxin [Kribbella sp.]HZX08070.1 antitoxin [Kribbella sp.]
MNDFQEQAKNWLRNVVKQNPDKIKAGVEKAGDLIDKQTGGKYADKVDAVQQKVDSFVDKQNSEDTPSQPGAEPAQNGRSEQEGASEPAAGRTEAAETPQATAEPESAQAPDSTSTSSTQTP